MLIACLLFLAAAAAVSAAAAGSALHRASAARAFADARQGLYAISSVSEDVAYRKIKGMAIGDMETLTIGSVSATADVDPVFGGLEIRASATGARFARKSLVRLAEGTTASFQYAVQAGAGGIELDEDVRITGDMFSNAPIEGNDETLVRGTVVSAGSSGRIEEIHATSSAYAHTIRDSDIDGDAYYQTISGTTVGGELHHGSADVATASFPISDTLMEQWKTDAAAGGMHTSPCSYAISGIATLGPKKINCNLIIDDDAVVTLEGPVWVVGNLTVTDDAEVKVSSSLSGKSIAIIADNPSNRSSASKVTVSNDARFTGAGESSVVLLLSRNHSASQGGGTTAISVSEESRGDVFYYAGYGEIEFSDEARALGAAGYALHIEDESILSYEPSLLHLSFPAGPSGGYTIESWKETE